GGAVAGDGHVALLAGQRRVGIVAGPGPQGAGPRALDDNGVDLDGRDHDTGQGVALGGVAGAVVGLGLRAAELDGQLRLQPVLQVVRGQRIGQEPDGDDRRDDREARQQPAGDGPRPERLEEELGSVTEPVGLLGGQGGVSHAVLPNSKVPVRETVPGPGPLLVPTPDTDVTRWWCWW